jgi:hypothetical protein
MGDAAFGEEDDSVEFMGARKVGVRA